MTNLLERRVPHSIALYIGVAWGCLQFTHFIVNEFLLSPHWTRVVLATILLFLPSVLMLAWFHGKPGRNRVTLTEKIGLPVNLAAAAVVLALAFSGTDLGAAVTRVTVENEDGEPVERAVPKTEFRKRATVFAFDTGTGLDEDDAWVSYLTPMTLTMDLLPDNFFQPVTFAEDELQEAGFQNLRNVPFALKREVAENHHTAFVVSGTVDRDAGRYAATMAVHRVDNGMLVDERRYEGPDLLDLVDRMSVDLRSALEIPVRGGIEDLPVRERLTPDDTALEALGRGFQALFVDSDFGAANRHFRAATTIDPTFAAAQVLFAQLLLASNRPEEAVEASRAALDHAYRLPERLQFEVKWTHYLITNQPSRAWAVIEMWAELYPEDPSALGGLLDVQENRGDREGMLATLLRMYELDNRNADILKRIAEVQEGLGNGDAALATLQRYARMFPADYTSYTGLAALHRRLGQHEVARENLEQALLIEPDRPEILGRMASLDREVGRFADARAGYDRALALARAPQERAAAHDGLRRYHAFRGEMEDAVAAMNDRAAQLTGYMTPVQLAQRRLNLGDVATWFEAGRADEAIALFEALTADLPPLFAAYHVPRWELRIALEREDLAAAREAHGRALQGMVELQLTGARAGLVADDARIDELVGDHESALAKYRRAAALAPTTPRHRSIGRTLRELGRLGEAEGTLREALRLSPADPHVHLEMARVLERKSDAADAVEHLRRALAAWENADAEYEPAREARERLAALGG